VGDFVVQRADGVFAYQLAVVVDDAAMQITHVLRGDDLLGSTARQLQLFRALGAAPPRFAHVGLLHDAHGARMAKREASADVSALLEQGVPPARIRAVLDGLCGFDGRLERFDLTRVPRGPQRLTAAASATLRAP